MKTVQLSGSPRANVGKTDAKAVRNSGRVPCVLYGTGEQIYFSVRNIDMLKIVVSPDVYIVELDIEGTKKTGIIQELQMHPVKEAVQHVDFLELVDNKPVVVGIPVNLVGRSKGVLSGGRLQQVFRRLKVQALPKDLPSEIQIDITSIKIGQSRRVSDVVLPGVTMLDPQNAVVVSVKRARGAVISDDEDEAVEESSDEAAEESAE